MTLNDVISIYNKIFSFLRIRIVDKLFKDKTLWHHVALCMWLAWTLVTGKISRSFLGFGNKICILCCDGDIFAKHINLFIVFPNFSLKDWECHMNGVQWSFIQTPTEDMLRKKTCNTCHANFLKFNKVTCKVLHLSQDTHQYQYMLRDEWIERSPMEKDLEMLVSKKIFHDLAVCTGSPGREPYPGLHKKCNQQVKGGDHDHSTPLLWDITFSTMSSSGRSGYVGRQRRATKILRGLEHFFKERLRKIRLFGMEKRNLWGESIGAFRCITENCWKRAERLLPRAAVTGQCISTKRG